MMSAATRCSSSRSNGTASPPHLAANSLAFSGVRLQTSRRLG
jgi:hypothetical protein